ncbi:MAG: hypothetical protein OXG37_03575 [Actinomycetia bacterium]|nr:hypothetical protein [Actinomycetes bacterium]
MRRTVLIATAAVLAAGLGAVAAHGQEPAPGVACDALPAGTDPDRSPEPFQVPAGGRLVTGTDEAGFAACTIYRADGTLFAQQSRGPEGKTLRVRYFDGDGSPEKTVFLLHAYDSAEPGREPAARKPVRTLAASLGCAKEVWSHTGEDMAGTIRWHWNKNSFHQALRTSTVRAEITQAHNVWQYNRNWCGVPDESNVLFAYAGTTTVAYNSRTGDGTSTRDYGSMTEIGCGIAIACAVYHYEGDEIDEFDIRMSSTVKTDHPTHCAHSNVTCWAPGVAGNYDIRSIMVHEVGHGIGFMHVHEQNQVMYYRTFSPNPNGSPVLQDQWRKLGKGDAKGNNHYHGD